MQEGLRFEIEPANLRTTSLGLGAGRKSRREAWKHTRDDLEAKAWADDAPSSGRFSVRTCIILKLFLLPYVHGHVSGIRLVPRRQIDGLLEAKRVGAGGGRAVGIGFCPISPPPEVGCSHGNRGRGRIAGARHEDYRKSRCCGRCSDGHGGADEGHVENGAVPA